ncbi:MAG: ribonuclease III [Planctomycetota bacterium]
MGDAPTTETDAGTATGAPAITCADHGVDEAQIDRLEALLGHRFTDRTLLVKSLVHASHAEERLHSNERLEFLGDAVLGMLVCEMIFQDYPGLLEGEMTKIKSSAVSRRACAKIARSVGLDDHLVLGKGMQGGEALPQSLAAAVLESVVAALYLDGGYAAVRRFLSPHIAEVIEEAAESGHQQNYKSVLQQHAQQTHGHTPNYIVLDEKGPDHAKAFQVCVELEGSRYAPTWGKSKKQAEQHAALAALQAIGVLESPDED